ncbi:MAG: hypothetical protein H0X66_03210 [Verrucomicrobia bacterium]|nr:hypothetical protein [Verrucomicrobiota bacterium]
MKTYQTYKGLPAVSGLCSMEDAAKPGLSIEDCVARLKRYHWVLKRLHYIFLARLTAEPIYELKMAFSLHGHYCAEHVSTFAKRVGEMREPPLGLDAVPDKNLDLFLDEILCAPTTEELLVAVYEKALTALKRGLESHIRDTNPLADAPSVRLCRHAFIEVDDMIEYGKTAVACLVDKGHREKMADWLVLLDDCLAAAGDLDGSQSPAEKNILRQHSAKPFAYDKVPKRDERFPDPYNMGVNAEVFLYDETKPAEAKVLMMFYKRLREIDVPEMQASIIVETQGKPWDYYRDMTRQLWDEARHAMMGEVGFASIGVDWPRNVMINHTWALGLNTQLTPIERHGVLYFIEQGLMPKTGKRYEWEVGLQSQNALSATFQDYDWADEVLHARIGRDWYLKNFDTPREGVEYGDKCWSKVLMGWKQWRDEGLTEHRNWWPDCYQDACTNWGITPDPEVLAYNTSYEQVRADLKNLSASA